jgi:hypothetical protein
VYQRVQLVLNDCRVDPPAPVAVQRVECSEAGRDLDSPSRA